jgi:hypothetical protein
MQAWQLRQQHCRCFQSSFKKTATPQSGFFVFSLAEEIIPKIPVFTGGPTVFSGIILKFLEYTKPARGSLLPTRKIALAATYTITFLYVQDESLNGPKTTF